jgi:hypothetical protein
MGSCSSQLNAPDATPTVRTCEATPHCYSGCHGVYASDNGTEQLQVEGSTVMQTHVARPKELHRIRSNPVFHGRGVSNAQNRKSWGAGFGLDASNPL